MGDAAVGAYDLRTQARHGHWSPENHSARRAIIGSIRLVRRAETTEAAAAAWTTTPPTTIVADRRTDAVAQGQPTTGCGAHHRFQDETGSSHHQAASGDQP